MQDPAELKRLLWALHSITITCGSFSYLGCVALGYFTDILCITTVLPKREELAYCPSLLFLQVWLGLPFNCFQFLVCCSMRVRVKVCKKQQAFVACDKHNWYSWFPVYRKDKTVTTTRFVIIKLSLNLSIY